jgi:hypothetical protein
MLFEVLQDSRTLHNRRLLSSALVKVPYFPEISHHLVMHLKLGHDHFVPHPTHSALYKYTELLITSLNRVQAATWDDHLLGCDAVRFTR